MKLSEYVRLVLENSGADKVVFDIPIIPQDGEILVPEIVDGSFLEGLSRLKFTVKAICPNEVTQN
jgi:hypothetical protein